MYCVESNSFSKIGIYSIDIYCIHMFFVYLVKDLMQKCTFNYYLQTVILIVLAIVICYTISLLSKYILRKFKIYKFFIGGR